MPSQEILRKYSDLLLEVGLGFKKGQKLLVSADSIHLPYLAQFAERAYELGAAFVDVQASYDPITKARLEKSDEAYLDQTCDYEKARMEDIKNNDWATIRFDGSADPDILNSVDQERSKKWNLAQRQLRSSLLQELGAHRMPWCVASLPTPGWAAKVFGGEPSEEKAEALWELLIPILRLDKDNPVAYWQEHAKNLQQKAESYNQKNFVELSFQAPGTDFKVTLADGTCWAGGGTATPGGQAFVANIPTEEIFSSPHWAKTEGRLQVTRPVHVLNGVVEGAFFEFKNGRVENYGAKSGQEQLDNFFAIDERARFAGEIALVDVSSPIFQCGKMLHSILFDENAACHLALGAAYPLGYEHSEISSESLQELGFNQSILHTDFMFGSNELKILAKDKGGQEHLVMDQGRFQF